MQSAIIINRQSILPGETKTVILNSYELHTKTKIEIPVYVLRSKNDGPVMLLSAGMHGEETNGIEIVRKVMLHDEVSKLNCGTLIAIPVINVISFYMVAAICLMEETLIVALWKQNRFFWK